LGPRQPDANRRFASSISSSVSSISPICRQSACVRSSLSVAQECPAAIVRELQVFFTFGEELLIDDVEWPLKCALRLSLCRISVEGFAFGSLY
jgi:hypothetical protein